MGCDIHFVVTVRKENTGLLAPIFGTVSSTSWTSSTTPSMSRLEPRYFRNYTIFGILTGGGVRGGSILNCFEQEIPESFNEYDYMLPQRGKLPFGRVQWDMYVKEKDEFVFKRNLTNDQVEQVYDQFNAVNPWDNKKEWFAWHSNAPVQLLSYYFDTDLHSHNYFTLKQLKKVIKRIDKLVEASWINAITRNELNGVKSVLNDIKKDVRAIVNLSSGFYSDEPEDEDIVVLISFDN